MPDIPCRGCNTLARDLNITYEELEEAQAIVQGKMVRHLKGCPSAPKSSRNPLLEETRGWRRSGDFLNRLSSGKYHKRVSSGSQ